MAGFHSNASHAGSIDQPVSPVDIVQPKRQNSVYSGPPISPEQTNTLKPIRTARFAEATSVNSPVDPLGRSPFADSNEMSESNNTAAPNVSDVGFGYVADNGPGRNSPAPEASRNASTHSNVPGTPLRSALKAPGTPHRLANNPLSPTFREEQVLEMHEEDTEKENAKDLKVKVRVRLAKVLLRGISFSCSLIILALIGASFMIFKATRNLPSRNSLTPWASDTNPWPQILILVIASLSILLCLAVVYGHCRGGRRAEKANVYYTVFAVFFFTVTVVLWVVAAATLQDSKSNGEGKDFWGWACKDNPRRDLFKQDVDYELVCRMQDWVLICVIIEVVVDTITIAIYAIIFYRFYSKRKLRKSMDVRDKARSDLYLAHLRSQSAPNTPGYPLSPGASRFPSKEGGDPHSNAEHGEYYGTQYAKVAAPETAMASTHQPFQLQPPPSRSQLSNRGSPRLSPTSPPQSPGMTEIRNQSPDVAPGEKSYESVPIPSAYASPMASPAFAPQNQHQVGYANGHSHNQ